VARRRHSSYTDTDAHPTRKSCPRRIDSCASSKPMAAAKCDAPVETGTIATRLACMLLRWSDVAGAGGSGSRLESSTRRVHCPDAESCCRCSSERPRAAVDWYVRCHMCCAVLARVPERSANRASSGFTSTHRIVAANDSSTVSAISPQIYDRPDAGKYNI
jgi:hypothetical protein